MMPSFYAHITQAKHNEKFANSLVNKSSLFFDWALTGIFYSSIHYIEAFFATKSIHSKYHMARDTEIGNHLGTIYNDYRDLKEYSEDVRYKCKTVSEVEINESKQKLENIKNYLKSYFPK